ncbi:MAG: clp protease ATP binding subunit [Parcubacteria group bacterium GW2011_GWA1_43_21]|uniref:Clp R domain-containing protein n=2 Tax=Candidatus Vogeliibacteriota TaxID=1817922 RepID=A0A1G2QBU9_9BACT|nr:MAG: clp protease ATP binding subunit [Parcubacteria group bacterium GW2011_GWB1_42_9]KKT09577.1 MAG: clp protease ATP binding subunit [Parcubacteria group bacterium GW2011_GWA1_43_21]OHA57903.1 MAG: hypothetical protein A2370_02740 [Candidatus Vogelbacteria bacterium RIFOXYB1_FULL_42_16]OHA58041.1 MAG: hypothetical protein A2607_00295 [Candidatus Vogelbacteria bacterium RIFOXYD1_FULL_42_15]
MNSIKEKLQSSPLYPILVLDSLISIRKRRALLHWSRNLLVVLGFIFGLFLLSDILPVVVTQNLYFLLLLKNKILGLVLILLSIFSLMTLLEFYFSSFYYLELVAKNLYRREDIFSISVGRIFYSMTSDDLLVGFLRSDLGLQIMRRLGISVADIDNFFQSEPAPVSALLLEPSNNEVIKMRDLAKYLFAQSPAWRDFLLAHNVKETEFLGAVRWVILGIESYENARRWWTLDNLSRTPGLARDWAYGGTYYLDQYSRDLVLDQEVSSLENLPTAYEKEITQIETILSRSREANVLLVGPAGPDKIKTIYRLVRMIKDGQSVPALAGKRAVLLEVAMLSSALKDKNTFEQTILKILEEAVRAGNVLLVIDDLANLLLTGEHFETNVVSLLDPFLASGALQVIALCDTDNFHRLIEAKMALMSRFEKVTIESLSNELIAETLMRAVWKIENDFGLFFTYQAVNEIASGAIYYFTDSVSSEKAIDLLIEIAPWAKRAKLSLIGASEVQAFIQSKTNIPLGAVTAKEKDKLLNLESLLSGRVIGQKEAINVVASAIRRARAGVRNPNRPIGSFLFLGPTGVGKTETAKALAATFFGGENEMRRIDMSEFQGSDASDKLIGSFATGQQGILSVMAREHPYGVILLDEFEKTSSSALNIFLPIFDEGFFSDMSGRRVSVRNIIFVATSNAGADTIWQMFENGKQFSRQALLDDIVGRGLFKPELLNRFDATVIFQPLGDQELLKIAELQLKKLAKRLEERGLVLKITDDLSADVAKNGADRIFGARPMLRYIQDKIEQPIANKLIAGELSHGMSVAFQLESQTGQLTILGEKL